MNIKELTIEEKLGQKLMIGIGKKEDISNVIVMIKKHHIGGVLLYGNNFDTYDEMKTLITKLHDANKANKIPLFIAIDQEGGIVNRMPDEFLNLYSANKFCLTADDNLLKDAAKVTGRMLYETGVNLDFAPVLDLKNIDNKGLGNRCFSIDKEEVSKLGLLYMKELNKCNIVSVVKHFPGHGSTKKDSHFILPIIKKYSELSDDLYPFETAIKNNCDAIMVSHLLIKDVDLKYPCSMSKAFINKKLRQELNYNGVIITDDVRMHIIRLLYGKYKTIKKAFFAGNDIVLIKYKNKDFNIINKILPLVKDEKEIDDSVSRILKLKEKYKISNQDSKGCNINDINIEIKRINNEIKNKL